eukprot:768043-Hanusia_phi.AAC.6
MVEGMEGRSRAVVVEMPGRVEDERKAIEALGGSSSLSSVFSRPRALLPLLLRTGDPHAHPIFGDPEPRTHLLLRVRKPNGEGQCAAEVLGQSERIYTFRGMADFQFVDPATAAKARGAGGPAPADVYSLLEGQTGGETLQLVPPIFSKVDQPQAYGFRQNMAYKQQGELEEQAEVEGGRPGRRRKSRDSSVLKKQSIQWRHPPPAAPHAQAVEATRDWEGRETSVQVLKRLFEQRPIWSRLALQGTMLQDAEKHLRFLPLVAFNYKDGPWRSLWVRYGFDPRSDKSTRLLQRSALFCLAQRVEGAWSPESLPCHLLLIFFCQTLASSPSSASSRPLLLSFLTEQQSYDFRAPSKFLSLFKPSDNRVSPDSPSPPLPSPCRRSCPPACQQTTSAPQLCLTSSFETERPSLSHSVSLPASHILVAAWRKSGRATTVQIPPQAQVMYQLLDIDDAQIQNFLQVLMRRAVGRGDV